MRRVAFRQLTQRSSLPFSAAKHSSRPLSSLRRVNPSTQAPLPRHFLQSRALGHSGVHSTAQAELQEEVGREDKTPKPETPSGWTVQHTAGTKIFTMKKSYQDEALDVFCAVPLEIQMDSQTGAVFQFDLVVAKAGRALVFDLHANEGELVIDAIRYQTDATVAMDRSSEGMHQRFSKYPGPALGELNEELMESFIAYLEERGVNDSFAEFIESYIWWSEQQEYEAWLGEVAEFTA